MKRPCSSMRAAVLCLVLPVLANGTRVIVQQEQQQHRQLPGLESCTDNPRDMIVSMDLQLEYPIEERLEICSDDEEEEIINTISEALNTGFDTTVPNWKGSVNFGPFHFDYDQEEVTQRVFDEEKCPERTEECAGKFCRWGCLSVALTDCGTSGWNRWNKLAEDVEAALVALEFECLGDPERLNVKLVVPGPETGTQMGTPPKEDSGDEGVVPPEDELEMGGDEEMPGYGNVTADGEEMEEDKPSVDDVDAEDEEEEVPVPPERKEEEADVDASSTRSIARGEDEDTTKSTSKSNGKSSTTTTTATNKYAADGSCQSNAVGYPVSVDLQITGATAACSADENKNLDAAIASELNGAFPTTVPDWDGQVSFGDVSFANARRRLAALRGFRQVQRHLSACGGRTIECTADSCLWGCVMAKSTDCGTSSLTNWANLAENVQAAVSALGYACLGSDVQVNIVVDDPEGQGVLEVVEEAAGQKSMENVEEESTAQGFDALLASFADDETVSDIPSHGLGIKSKFVFTFFPGTGRLPTDDEVKLANVATLAYFKQVFRANDVFGNFFQTMEVTEVDPKYDPASDPDEFVLKCMITVVVNDNAPVSAKEAAKIIADSNFETLIDDYLRVTSESQFFETFKVFFKGNTRASG